MQLTEVAFIEPENMNHDATNYVVDNYKSVCDYAAIVIGNQEMAQDLIHDVFISFMNAESLGTGYDCDYPTNDGSRISVAQYVFGRIRRCSKSMKYQKNYVESKKLNNSQDDSKVNSFTVFASSFDEDETGVHSDLNRAYANAASYDDIDLVEERLSLHENMDILFDIASLHKVDLIHMFLGIDEIGKLMDRKGCFDQFSGIRKLVRDNDMFGDAIRSVLEFASKDRSYFDEVVASYA